jgi:peptidoglycan hydrolase-like protein with peptidoglycan-binding domain
MNRKLLTNKALRRISVIISIALVLFTLMPTAFAADTGLLYIGSRGDAVTALQNRLLTLGYMDYYKATGYFGPITQSAVIRFQSMNGLYADGIVGPATNAKLWSGPKSLLLTVGSRGEAVSALQERLRDKGFFTYPSITGYYGSITRSAVIEFQRAYGLSADGIAGPNTRKALFASGSSTPAASPSAADIADVALEQLGKPYVYSTEGPEAFDCSGLAYYSMINAGFNVERLSAASFSENTAWTKITSISSLQKGDLLFFHPDTNYISHMGIYAGGGQFVHASSGQGKVMISDFGNSYWDNCFSFARRVS